MYHIKDDVNQIDTMFYPKRRKLVPLSSSAATRARVERLTRLNIYTVRHLNSHYYYYYYYYERE